MPRRVKHATAVDALGMTLLFRRPPVVGIRDECDPVEALGAKEVRSPTRMASSTATSEVRAVLCAGHTGASAVAFQLCYPDRFLATFVLGSQQNSKRITYP